MDNILLIFLNHLKDSNCFDNIINDFETQGYKLYLYDDVNSDSFSCTDLIEIIHFYQNEGKGVNKVVVLSNIRDLIYFWYRCYNQLVDDFIYLVEEEEVNFFNVGDMYYNVYYNIVEFNNIENETIEGKIYLTKKCNTILPLFYKAKYFQSYQYFDFNRKSYKTCINKTYELEEYIIDFNFFETNNRETIIVDKIDKRIVFFKGISGYDVLRIITDYYIEFFNKLGFEIDIVDFKDEDFSMLNEKLIDKKASFIYSTNCIQIDLKASDGRNLFDAIDTPFLGTLGDHPVNHYSRVTNAPKKMLFTCLDSENIKYLNKYFPDKKIITNYALGFKSKNYTERCFLEREIDLIFIGSLQEPDSILEPLKSYDPIILTIINNVCKKILNCNKMLNIDDELQQFVCQYNLKEYVRVFLHSTIERYIRNYKRYHLVKHLGQSGLKVVCIGKKEIYNKLNVSGNLLIYDDMDFQEMLDLFNNSKLLINMTGHLFNGLTERILSAMLNGAAVATERDLFTTSNFNHKENIILYDFNKLDLLVDEIKLYLKDVERLERVALSGQQAAEKYDFRTAAAKFPRIMRDFDTNFNKEISSTSSYLPDINQYKKYTKAIYNSQVINNGQLVNRLENRLAEYLNVRNVVLVPDILFAAQVVIKLLKIRGEVITTPFHLDTTKYNLIWNNLNPVFADIDEGKLNIDVDKIKCNITEKTSCILTNYLISYKIEQLKEIASNYNLKVIFDATHIFDDVNNGNSVLNQADISFLNLGESKYFQSMGGVALVIKDDDLYQEAINLTNILGTDMCINKGMNDFQAAMGLCILDEINIIKYKRKSIYNMYHKYLPESYMIPGYDTIYNYGHFPVIFNCEKELLRIQEMLEQNNIIAERYFYLSLNRENDSVHKDIPNAYNISKRILCLPISENMTENDVYSIIYLLK